jgi:hypothetical protein
MVRGVHFGCPGEEGLLLASSSPTSLPAGRIGKEKSVLQVCKEMLWDSMRETKRKTSGNGGGATSAAGARSVAGGSGVLLEDKMRIKYMNCRQNAVKSVFSICRRRGFQRMTCHAAVHMMDRLLNCMATNKSKYELVLGTAVMVATKFEEKDDLYLWPVDVCELLGDKFFVKEVVDMEACILQHQEFVVRMPTVPMFVSVLGPIAFLSDPDERSMGAAEPTQLDLKVGTKTITLLADQTLLNTNLLWNHPASMLACAIIRFAREELGMAKSWSSILAAASGYDDKWFEVTYSELVEFAETIMPDRRKRRAVRAGPAIYAVSTSMPNAHIVTPDEVNVM